jgi:1-acyl-sn-glycerol-3-phosphate acyltransferase
MRIDRLARTAVAMGAVGTNTAVHASAAIAAGLVLGPDHDLVSWIYRDYARLTLLACGARCVSQGTEALETGRRYVFVSNHQSHLDALAILSVLPRHGVRFVAKEELGRIPLFGHSLRATGNVFVGRHDTRSDVERLEQVVAERMGVCVLFFAEGTRSADGKLRAFKKGAAVFALKSGLPLVPIGVHGSFEILPPGFEVKGSGTIGISFGRPIETAGRKLEERETLTRALHAKVDRLIAKSRALAARS